MIDTHNTWNIWIERLLDTMRRIAVKMKIGHKTYAACVKRKEHLDIKQIYVWCQKKPSWACDIKNAGGQTGNDEYFLCQNHF